MAVLNRVAMSLFLFFTSVQPVLSAELKTLLGDWEGAIELPAAKLPIIIHVREEAGHIKITLDSPSQNVSGLVGANPKLDDNIFAFSVPAIAGRYEGEVNETIDTIEGTWSQGGASLPLNFKKLDTDTIQKAQINRPQHPLPPYPYTSEEIAFTSMDSTITLAGTLTKPEGNGPFPAFILISGSGPQTRDAEVFGHKIFLVISDYLTRNGFAVLRFDERGTGASTGDFGKATTFDFEDDTAAALRILQKRKDIDGDNITLLGHSEGAIIVSLAQEETKLATRLALINGPALPYNELVIDQVRALATLSGASPEQVENQVATQKRIVDAARAAGNDPVKVKEIVKQDLLALGVPEAEAEQQATQFSSPWFMAFLNLDPRNSLRTIEIPVLALFGRKDAQVDAQKNANSLNALQKDNIRTRIYDDLNHLMQPAKTGAITEYGEIEVTFSEDVLADLVQFAHKKNNTKK